MLGSVVVLTVSPLGTMPAFATPPAPPAAVNPPPYQLVVSTPGPTWLPSNGLISTDTVWSAQGSPYVITNGLSVSAGAALTLLPGTIVKFAPGSTAGLTVQGALLALGTPAQPVVFTSLRDDSVGGDTNGDGGTTSPGRGDWTSIAVSYPGSMGYLDHADIRYGGGGDYGLGCYMPLGEVMSQNNTRLAVANSHLSQSATAGVMVGQSDAGYAGIFNSRFDSSSCGGQSVLQDGPNMVVGNTFGMGIAGSAWATNNASRLVFRGNTASSPLSVGSSPQGSQIDVRFNTLLGGVAASGVYSANWFGHDINTEVLPACMTQAEMDAHVPRLAIATYSSNCPSGSYPPQWEATVLPALSGPPPGVPQAVYDATSAKYGPVDTSSGGLTYQAADLVVQDAGKTLTATRMYSSRNTVDGDAGPGWSTSFSEALSTFQGLSALTLADGSSLPFAMDPTAGYTPAGGVDADFLTGPSGSTITMTDLTSFQFDTAGELTGLLLGDPGHQVTVERSGGKVARVTGVSGRYLSYARTSGHLSAVSDSQGRTVNLTYGSGRLASATGVDGQSESYEYDGNGRLTKVTAPSGKVLLAAAYEGEGKVAWVEEPGVGRTTFSYNPGARQTTITRADGVQVVQDYDEHGRLIVERVVGGAAQHVILDGWGRQIVRVQGVPSTAMIGYRPLAGAHLIDGRGDVAAAVDPAGRAVATSYDSAHRPVKTTYADGGTVVRGYETNGRLSGVTDQLDKTWTYTYNSRGQVLTQTNPLGQVRQLTYEPDGDLATVTDAGGAVTGFEYDSFGRPITRIDAGGHRWTTTYTAWGEANTATTPGGATATHEFDVDRRLTAEIDGAGGRTSYEYDSGGRLSATVDALGQRATTEYDSIGRVVRITDVRGGVTSFGYSPDGFITSATNPANAVTTIANDPAGRPIRVTDPLSQVTQTTYDPSGQVAKIERPDGSSTAYTFDVVGRKAAYTSGRGFTWTYTYDKAGHLTKTTDPLGYTRLTGFDALGRTTSTTDELDNVTTASYDDTARTITVTDSVGTAGITANDALGHVVSETDGSGRITRFEYNADGLRTATVDPGNGRSTFEYDGAGRLSATVDQIGRRTVLTLDALGQMRQVTDPAGHSTVYTYEPGGQVASVTDRTGMVSSYGYDARGLRTTSTDPLGKVTAYTYDLLGRQTKVVDPTGVEQNTACDPVGRPAVIWDLTGASWVNTYDNDGNLLSETDPAGVTMAYTYTQRDQMATIDWAGSIISVRRWSYTYDNAGRLATSTRPLGVAETFAYDQRGRRTTYTNEQAKTTTFSYDGAGRQTGITTPSGKTTSWTYDAAGRMATAADPLDNTARYGYDAAGQLSTLTLPRGGAYTYTYNQLGGIATETDPNLKITTYSIDNEGRPTRADTPAGRAIVSRYDAAGRLWQSEAGGVVREFGYDDAGRLTSTKVAGVADTGATYNNRGLLATSVDHFGTTSYTYDDARRITRITSPTGMATNYTYVPGGLTFDYGAGLVATVRGPVNVNYTYDKEGHVTQKRFVWPSNARTDSYAYGAQGRMTSRTEAASAATTYTYTDDGRIATVSEPVTGSPDPKITTNGYDNAERLVTQRITQGATTLTDDTYGLDADGNRASVTHGTATPVTYSYDLAGRLQSSSDGHTYSYDDDGNQTATTGPAAANYGYNPFGELDSYQPGSGPTVAYRRDALGRTNSRASNGTTQYLGYHGTSGTLAATATGAAAPTAIIRGNNGDTLAQANAGGAVLRSAANIHHDITSWQDDNTGATTTATSYDPFGAVTSSTGAGAPVNLGYQASLTDSASGLVDMGARSYDPHTNRFTAADNLTGAYGAPISTNRYAYANADPVNLLDPDGHWPGWLDNIGKGVGDYFNWWGDQWLAGITDQRPTVKEPGWMHDFNNTGPGRFINGMNSETGATVQGVGNTLLYGSACIAGASFGFTRYCHKFDSLTTKQGWSDAAKALYEPIVECVQHPQADICGHALVAGYNILTLLDGAGTLARTTVRAIPKLATKPRLGDLGALKRGVGQDGSAVGRIGEAEPKYDFDPIGCRHSFDPDTKVLLADGSTKAIKDIHVGDAVKATDPGTAKTSTQTVTALHINHDTDLTDITISGTPPESSARAASGADHGNGTTRGPTGVSAVLHTTQHHPFWDATIGAWVNAAELSIGDRLTGSDGKNVYVTSVRNYSGSKEMRDITVANVHAYYVIAADKPVLVHNCPPGDVDAALPGDGNSVKHPIEWRARRPGVDRSHQDPVPPNMWITDGSDLAPGRYTYVVMPDRAGRAVRAYGQEVRDMIPSPGHTSLAQRQPVIMAGTFEVGADGRISYFSNFSGHYKPGRNPGFEADYDVLRDIALDAFERSGFRVTEDVVWDPHRWRK
jgi:RHS repeat-associated protein